MYIIVYSETFDARYESGIWFNMEKLYIVHVLEQSLSLVGRARAGRIVRKIYLDAGKKSDFSTVAKIE